MTIPCRHPCFSLNSCPPGKNQGGTGQAECDDCVPGTFSTNSSSSFCEDCPGDTSSLGGSTECDRCNKFFYRELEVQGGDCLNCPEGTTCDTDGASTQEKLLIDPGFWRIQETSQIIYPCPIVHGCKGGVNFTMEGDGYCREGYTGPLCAVVSPRNDVTILCTRYSWSWKFRRLFFFHHAQCMSDYFFNRDAMQCTSCDEDIGGSGIFASSTSTMILCGILFLLLIMCWRIKKWYFEKMDDYSEEEIAYRKERAARRWKAIEPKLRSLMAFYQIVLNVR